MQAFYSQSSLYSAFFEPSEDIRRSVDRLVRRHLRRAPRRVLDPACGPGLWLSHFQKGGAEVAGCDLEARAIALASDRLPKRGAKVLVGDMRRPPDELGADFDCAINLDNSIGHLADYMDVAEHLASIRRRLSPRGIYILGLALREDGDEIESGVVYERGPVDVAGGGFAALRTESLGLQPTTRCERIRQIAITANVPDTPAVIAEQYDLLTFTFAMLRDVMAAAGGFEVLGCHDATDESLPEKAFRKSAGDVVLVLRPASARPASRAVAARRTTKRKR
ncbi:MAG: class I SAM-dependent methyltransferase [bacterium]|jgi:SAM-dependent methyltransferase